MLADIGQNKQIARLGPEPSAMALLRDTNARPCIDTGRYFDFDLFRFRRHALAVAEGAWLATASSAFAIGTALRELQPSAGLHYLAAAFASGTRNDRPARVARTLATRTLLAAVDRNICGEARERLFKTQCQRYFNIAAHALARLAEVPVE